MMFVCAYVRVLYARIPYGGHYILMTCTCGWGRSYIRCRRLRRRVWMRLRCWPFGFPSGNPTEREKIRPENVAASPRVIIFSTTHNTPRNDRGVRLAE